MVGLAALLPVQLAGVMGDDRIHSLDAELDMVSGEIIQQKWMVARVVARLTIAGKMLASHIVLMGEWLFFQAHNFQLPVPTSLVRP